MKRRKEKIANYSNARPATIVQAEETLPWVTTGHKVLSDPLIPEANERYRCTSPTSGNGSSIYEDWKKAIASHGPYSYLWTLSFIHPYSDTAAIDGLAQWSKFANRKIYGPRWKNHNKGIEATVIAERHEMSHSFRGRLHFHVLVKAQDALFDLDDVTKKFKDAALLLADDSDRRMTDIERIDVRPITDEAGLIDYLVKKLVTWEWKAGDNVMWLDWNGIDGVALPTKNSKELMRYH